MLSGNRVNTGHDWNRLYRYNPTGDNFERVVTPELDAFIKETSATDITHGLRIFGDSLLIFNGRGLCQFNLVSKKVRTLVYAYGKAKWDFPWRIERNTTFALVNRGLVCVSVNQLLYFRDGKKQPLHITGELFQQPDSDKLEVRDILPVDRGLYLLTPHALYLIPNISALPVAAAESPRPAAQNH